MIDWLVTWDTIVFHFINGTIANPVTDVIMPIVTNDWLLRILFAVISITLLVVGKKRFFWIVVFSLIVVVISDQSSSALLKPLIGRLRPCKIMEVRLLVENCGAGKSFPSSHAANLFAQALFFGLLFRQYRWYFVLFAGIVGISRVFVGVHYPLDVLGGCILGGLEGALAAFVFLRLNGQNKLRPRPYVE